MWKWAPGGNLPPETSSWQKVEDEARSVFHAYNFRELRTPIIERTELFARSVGADTDIVVASAKAYISALNKLESKMERVNPQHQL